MTFTITSKYLCGYRRLTTSIHWNTGLLCGPFINRTPTEERKYYAANRNENSVISRKGIQGSASKRTYALYSSRTKSSILEVDNEGSTCSMTWQDGFQSDFHSVWLRHNCHCEQCRHPNGQRLMDPTSVRYSIQVDTANIKDDNVEITWKGEENHKGIIPVKYLRDHNYNDETLLSFRNAVKIDKAVKEIQFIEYEDIKGSKEEYLRWLKQINESGLSIVKNVPVEEGMVQKVGQLISPVWETFYGVVFDVVSVAKPINVAYSNVHLDYHMDLVYFESPPGLQLLHCLRFDEGVGGGYSTFLDVFTHAEEFRINHPDHFHTLTTVPATFQKVHYERDYPVELVNQKPHIKLNHYGDIVAVYWAPTFEGPLSVTGKDVERYYAAYELFAKSMVSSPHQLKYKMSPGDLVIFNNVRMLHGRTQFNANGGIRHFQGCYINTDFFKSQTQVTNNLYGDGALVKRVGNQCWR